MKNKLNKKWILAIAFVGFILVIVLILIIGMNPFKEKKLQEELYAKAKTEMLLILKAPATASFSPDPIIKKFVLRKDSDNILNICGTEINMAEKVPEKYAGDGYQKYFEATFWVDAENSYGAKLRTYYTCLIDGENVLCEATEDSEYRKSLVCSS